MAIKFLTGESVDGLITANEGVEFAGGSIGTAKTVLHTNNVVYARGGTGGMFLQNSDGSDGIFIANDHVRVETNSSEQLRIDNSGNATFAGDVEVDGGDLTITSASSNSVINLNGGDSFVEKDSGTDLYIANNVSDRDIKFRVKDSGTNVIALTLDGSQNGDATFSSDIIVSGGDITLGGTGRIQGVDTVSASTDAANKAYVDAHTSGIQTLTEGDGIKITGTTTATISVNYDAADADNLIQAATAVTSINGAPSGYAAYVLVAESNPGVTYGAVNKIRVSDIHLEDFGAAEGNINLNSNKITNLSTPTASTDAANKSYVDSAVAGSPQGTVTGSGTSTRVAFWSSGSALSSDGDLFWDNTNKYLGVGTSLPSNPLDVSGNFTLQGNQYMADNYQIILGTGSDLKIFHDGTDSRILDSGNGLLKLQGSAVYLQHTTNGTTFTNMIEAISTYVKLNYSGSTKLQTASNGVNITGLINISGDAYVQGGDIHMNSNINVISNSASDVNLIIGDVANNDSIEQIDFHTFGKSQLTVFDDEITMNSSNVVLATDTKFTTGNDSQIKYNARHSR